VPLVLIADDNAAMANGQAIRSPSQKAPDAAENTVPERVVQAEMAMIK
jgi:hypothetical protein